MTSPSAAPPAGRVSAASSTGIPSRRSRHVTPIGVTWLTDHGAAGYGDLGDVRRRGMTAAVPAPGEDGDRELTVDELAARVGVTVRNLRAYSARGLLPPPRMVGRTGYYGREHVARLLLVREMLAEGYSLAMIERTLASAPQTASSATLALHRALLAPWLPPEPEVMTGAELAARAAVPENPVLIDRLQDLGLLERLEDDRLRVLDP